MAVKNPRFAYFLSKKNIVIMIQNVKDKIFICNSDNIHFIIPFRFSVFIIAHAFWKVNRRIAQILEFVFVQSAAT